MVVMTSPWYGMPRNGHFVCVYCYIFLQISRSWTWLYHQKANKTTFPTISCPYVNIVNFFTHKWNTFLCEQYLILPIQTNRGANAEKSQKQPLPLEACVPLSNTSMSGLTPPQMTARSLYALPDNYATKAQLVTMGRPKFTPKLPLPLRRSPPHLIHLPSTDPTHHPKRHPDPISRFAIIHFADRHTDGPCSVPCSVPWALRSLCWSRATH